MDQPNFELRSEEVQEIVSYVPHWLVRWGITVFFLALLGMVAISWMIHYPDIVEAPFRLTSRNAPKSVNSKVDGKLVRLLVADRSTVRPGQVLAHLESTADHQQVLALSAQLDTIRRQLAGGDVDHLAGYSLPPYSRLGELQMAYQTFDQAYTQFVAFRTDGFYPAKKKLLVKELADLIGLGTNLREQRQIYHDDWEIARREFELQKQLAEQKVIAVSDLRREESKLLARQLPLKQAETALLQNQAAQNAKRGELLEMDKLTGEQGNLFRQSLHALRSAVDGWKNRYVLTAPVGGKVFFTTLLEENQTLATNQEVFYIGPESNDYFGEVLVPQRNLGKVRAGQRVIIKLAGYPFQEFGTLTGQVAYLSDVPSKENTFLAKISLPKKLITNHGKPIAYRTGMSATAEIITEDTRLIEKVFYNFRKALVR